MLIDKVEYERFISVFPRVCVDIFVEDSHGHVLLLKRTNEPALGQWWFPGGRVYIGETRLEAARRKLREECGIEGVELKELGSFDLFFDLGHVQHHDVTIIFKLELPQAIAIVTDHQSSDYGWFSREDCRELGLHAYVKRNIHEHAVVQSPSVAG